MIARARERSTWLLGYQDETWWSRVARPALLAWGEPKQPLRLVDVAVPADDPLTIRLQRHWPAMGCGCQRGTRRGCAALDGRPVSALTIDYLTWCAEQAAAQAMTTLVVIWDHAGWHGSHRVRDWLRQHNQTVARTGHGVRLVPCWLPSRSPWLNPIEPTWGHGKRQVGEPDRVLDPDELEERLCQVCGCPRYPHLALSNDVA